MSPQPFGWRANRTNTGETELKIRILFAAVAALVIAAIAGTGGASAAGEHLNDGPKSQNGTRTADCINSVTGQKEGTFTYAGPLSVWPPNHKYVTATITLTDDDPETLTDEVTVAVTGTHDQVLSDGSELNGSGNTPAATDVVPGAPGAGTGSASTTVQFRAERSGRDKTGRTYTFTATGTTDNGLSECNPVTFTAVVPHDQGQRAGSSTKSTRLKRLARR